MTSVVRRLVVARLVVGVMVASSLVACTGGGGKAGAPSASSRPSPSTPSAVQRGGTLRVGIEPPRTLDPAQARSASEVVVARLLFQSLTTLDPDDAAVRPGVADRWQATPDQRHWDFHLRPEAQFSSGRHITPADVKFSLERIARKGSGAPDLLVSALSSISGFAPFNRTDVASELTGVTTPTPDLVHVDLDQPSPDLPAVLANPGFGIVPREAVEKPSPAFREEPVGSGPFVFGARDGDVIHLVRAPKSPAYLDRVDLVLNDSAESFRRFGSGELDWTLVPRDRVGEAAERFGRSGFVPYMAVLFYGFNLRKPTFADPRFREAIVHAIDRRAIGTAVYGGSVLPVDGLLPRGVPGWQRDPCGAKCTYDPAAAKRLLAQTFVSQPIPTFSIDFDDDPTQQAVARSIQANLLSVGIVAGLRPHPVDQYPQTLHNGDQELFRLGWVAVGPRADAFLTPLFHSGVDTNVTAFGLPAIDDLLDKARSTGADTARLALQDDAERRIMDQLPIIPIAQFQTLSVSGPRVRGLAVDGLGTFDGARVWLAG